MSLIRRRLRRVVKVHLLRRPLDPKGLRVIVVLIADPVWIGDLAIVREQVDRAGEDFIDAKKLIFIVLTR